MMFYAGIGSRETPLELRSTIESIAQTLKSKGYILRSGGAPGADTFFESSISKEAKEIYLPWKGFNGNTSPLYQITEEAIQMAERYHPGWKNLSDGAKKLMARNCYQVLGFDLKTPVEFIVCWTKDGKASGGTGQALRIAKSLDILVYNLQNEGDLAKLQHNLNKTQLF